MFVTVPMAKILRCRSYIGSPHNAHNRGRPVGRSRDRRERIACAGYRANASLRLTGGRYSKAQIQWARTAAPSSKRTLEELMVVTVCIPYPHLYSLIQQDPEIRAVMQHASGYATRRHKVDPVSINWKKASSISLALFLSLFLYRWAYDGEVSIEVIAGTVAATSGFLLGISFGLAPAAYYFTWPKQFLNYRKQIGISGYLCAVAVHPHDRRNFAGGLCYEFPPVSHEFAFDIGNHRDDNTDPHVCGLKR